MGYAICFGPCGACGTNFGYNPLAVPSFRKRPDGPREPVCKTCIERVNPQRIANGLEPIVPRPDAYEPVEENAL